MSRRAAALLGLLLGAFAAGHGAAIGEDLAPIPRLEVPPPKPPRRPLLVVHASRVFDELGVTKDGLDRWVAGFRSAGRPVVYLMSGNDPGDRGWLTEDREPDFALASSSGEHRLRVAGAGVTLAGGFLSLCLADSARRAVDLHFGERRRARARADGGLFTVRMAMDAIFEGRYAFRIPGDELMFPEPLWDAPEVITLAEAARRLGDRDFLASTMALLEISFAPEYYTMIATLGEESWGPSGTGSSWIYWDFERSALPR